MTDNFEKQISNCKTNMIEWCHDISKAPTDGREIIAYDNVDFFTCVAVKEKILSHSNFVFVRSSLGCPIDIGDYRYEEFDQVHIKKWAFIPK